MECMLTTKGLWEHTQTTSETDRAGDSKARAAIGLYLAEQHLETFREYATAKTLWETLAGLFRTKSQARRLQLENELSALRLETGEPLVKYVSRAKHLLSQLKAAGTTMEEDELCLSVLNKLPGEFDMITTVLTVGDTVLTLEDTLAKLLLVETSHQKSTSGSKAYVARPAAPAAAYKGQKGAGAKQKSKEIRKCHHCGKPGHLQADCWQKQREEGASESKHQGQGFKRNEGNQGNLAATAYQICAGQAWILDSGASTHITQSQPGMSNLRAAPADLHITFGNVSWRTAS